MTGNSGASITRVSKGWTKIGRFEIKESLNLFNRTKKFLILKIFSLISLFVFYFFQTYGTFKLTNLSNDGRSRYYAAQAQSFLNGVWGIDPAFAGGECLTYTDDCRAYFGIFPSIIRIPIIFFTDLELNPLFVLVAYALCVLGSYKIIVGTLEYLSLNLNKISEFALAICLVASPVLFLSVRGYMYEEALLWGIGLLSLTTWQLINYWNTGIKTSLYLAILLATCTLHSRIIEGVIALSAISITLLFQRNIIKNYRLFFLLLGSFVSLLIVNYLKFRVLVPSMRFHETYLRIPYLNELLSKCGDLKLSRIPYEFLYYFVPNLNNLFGGFAYSPNDYTFRTPLKNFSNDCIEQSEYFSPITVLYPLLSLVGMLGLIVVLKRHRTQSEILGFIVSYALGLFLLLSFVGMTQRYLSEFYILFLFLGTIFLAHLPRLIKNKLLVIILIIVLGVLQTWQGFWVILNFWSVWLDRPVAFENLIQLVN